MKGRRKFTIFIRTVGCDPSGELWQCKGYPYTHFSPGNPEIKITVIQIR
jgi:hypothetical protein